jgi:small subunit ribosomal protein S7
MPRRREVPVRTIIPDAKYNSTLVAKFIASIMRDGKKAPPSQFFTALSHDRREDKERAPLKVFEQALENVRPMIEVKSRRVGGSTYQVPTEIRPSPKNGTGNPVGDRICPQHGPKKDGQQTCRRIDGCRQQRGGAVKKKGRHAQDGRGQQGFCPFPLVTE